MSSGAFVQSFYTSSYTPSTVHPITVQPETLNLSIGGQTNASPGGPAGSPISASVSRGKRAVGLNARTVTVRFDEGEEPDDYLERAVITLPWLNPTTFAAIKRGDSGTYLGGGVKVVGISNETAR